MRMAEHAVEVQQLRRVFKGRRKAPDVVALDSVDLAIPAGEVHGLLGPNGAGKTTLCKILSTVLLPTAGYARVAGHDVVRETADVRRIIGIVFGGERGLYTRLTARQNLEFWAAMYGQRGRAMRQRVDAMLSQIGLAERADDRVEGFSRGMKQRLHLARGLIGDPQVVLLDEPTTGMDPMAAREFRTLVDNLRDDGRTILLATHDMAEAEAVCDRVTLIDNGRLLATERPAALSGWISAYSRVDARDVPVERVPQLISELQAIPGVVDVQPTQPAGIRVETDDPDAAPQVIRHLLDAGITSVSTSTPDLEEVYLQIIGKRGLRVSR
jgi:ABC-2 type transport system ATP-binding protein